MRKAEDNGVRSLEGHISGDSIRGGNHRCYAEVITGAGQLPVSISIMLFLNCQSRNTFLSLEFCYAPLLDTLKNPIDFY